MTPNLWRSETKANVQFVLDGSRGGRGCAAAIVSFDGRSVEWALLTLLTTKQVELE